MLQQHCLTQEKFREPFLCCWLITIWGDKGLGLRKGSEPVLGSQCGGNLKEGVKGRCSYSQRLLGGQGWVGTLCSPWSTCRRSYGITALGRTKADMSFCFSSVQLRQVALLTSLLLTFSRPEIQQKFFWCKKSWIQGILNENISILTFLVLTFKKNSLEFLNISNL